eukprot:CAMPEP_0115281864 /NCGR_PEP_ID=MMETSP0270-20121206/59542_1 /TAXON_ID=71861 /ORGANISM="Scrippsiella trochoidea, Strain CCMP3099" /LENGTH=172 /DNA_ID=CAMNT_0002698683 /DNA_START=52 /DNA_END=567 /DNA_ORIENTATION=-
MAALVREASPALPGRSSVTLTRSPHMTYAQTAAGHMAALESASVDVQGSPQLLPVPGELLRAQTEPRPAGMTRRASVPASPQWQPLGTSTAVPSPMLTATPLSAGASPVVTYQHVDHRRASTPALAGQTWVSRSPIIRAGAPVVGSSTYRVSVTTPSLASTRPRWATLTEQD